MLLFWDELQPSHPRARTKALSALWPMISRKKVQITKSHSKIPARESSPFRSFLYPMIRMLSAMNMNSAENDIARLARHTMRVVVDNSSRMLASNFEPGPGDVICSRGKGAIAHVSCVGRGYHPEQQQSEANTAYICGRNHIGGKQSF
jgi:hypothetical protein